VHSSPLVNLAIATTKLRISSARRRTPRTPPHDVSQPSEQQRYTNRATVIVEGLLRTIGSSVTIQIRLPLAKAAKYGHSPPPSHGTPLRSGFSTAN